jgi:hypothetical protein
MNYLYELDLVEARHEAFVGDGSLDLSRALKWLLMKARPWTQVLLMKGDGDE